MSMWEYVVQIHSGADVGALVPFYGVILAAVCFLALQLVRAARVNRRIAELEGSLAERVDEKTAEVATKVSERMGGIDAQARDLRQGAETLRQRVDHVEDKIPSLYDRLEEFRNTLAHIFQNELGAVLGSFDTSVSAVLEHMKADLHTGLTRIESIQEMVKSRQTAGRALLRGGEAAGLLEGDDAEETAEQVGEPAIELERLMVEADNLDIWVTHDGPEESITSGAVESDQEESAQTVEAQSEGNGEQQADDERSPQAVEDELEGYGEHRSQAA
jgi:hypothetical protein